MRTRILGGIAGCLLASAPLLVVDAVDYFGIYYYPDPFVVGAVALVAGLLLGGIAAGLIGGRSPKTGGGVAGAGTTGLVAAALYAISVIGLMEAARAFDALPLAVTEHPIRASLGIVFLAALLLLVAFVTGAFAGKSAEAPAAGAQPRAQMARPASAPNMPTPRTPGMSHPGGPASAYGPPPSGPSRFGDAPQSSRPAGPRPSGPQWQAPDASDPRYAGARIYGPASRPSRGPKSDPNHW